MARKGFYIDNELVLKRLSEVDNQSEYVTQLILKDILAGDNGVEFEMRTHEVLDSLSRQIEMIRKGLSSR
ncbi:MAG: hypothetical protein ACRDD7_15250 [Peptostreptococcaceae bacterium]